MVIPVLAARFDVRITRSGASLAGLSALLASVSEGELGRRELHQLFERVRLILELGVQFGAHAAS